MTKIAIIMAAGAMALSSSVFAADAVTPVVNFTTQADMPGIADPSQNNTFKVDISDAQIDTGFTLVCQAGTTKFMFLHRDKQCAINGTGSIINPSTQAKIPRTQYLGGFTVQETGNTDASTIQMNYLAVGRVSASNTTFNGDMKIKPQTTSSGSEQLVNAVLNKISLNTNGTTIDKRTDPVEINGLNIPSAGLPSDKGTTWNGNMIFAYQTNSWFIDLTASYNGKDYHFKGNMPWTDTKGVSNQTEYNLTMTLPTTQLQGDDALFANSDANNDLFASVDGISGKIIMKQSSMVTVKVDGADTTTPSRVDASGSFTGTNVPIEVVRSFATMVGLLADNFFGA